MPTLDAIREAYNNRLVTVRTHWLDDRLIIVNYSRECTYSAAWNETTTKCRGLILRLDAPWNEATQIQEVVALPFEKFFNHGEGGRYPESELIEVSEKMDGSLGILYRLEGGVWIATRGAFDSEQALWATRFLNNYKIDWSFLPEELTLLFEIIYPDNKIILNYGERCDLVLLGVRNRLTGEDFSPRDTRMLAGVYGFNKPKSYPSISIPALLESAKELGSDFEGWVCRFADGSRFKIKGRGYLAIAKAMNNLSPKRVFEAMRDGVIDDLEMNTPEEVLDEVQAWRETIQTRHNLTAMTIDDLYESRPSDNAKEFAGWVNANYKESTALLLAKFRGHDLDKAIWKYMDKRKMWE